MNRFIRAIREHTIDTPMVGNMIGKPKKDPNCKDPMCSPIGVRQDVMMGNRVGKFKKKDALRGGNGAVYCHCVTTDTIEKRRANRWRKFLGMELLK